MCRTPQLTVVTQAVITKLRLALCLGEYCLNGTLPCLWLLSLNSKTEVDMPIYETTDDRKREASIASILCCKWGCDAIMLPKLSVADAMLLKDDTVKAFVEIKARGKQYDTYMISARKIADLKHASEMFQVMSLVIVSFPDHIAYFDASIEPDKVEKGGRTDRHDSNDVEQMNHYNIGRLKTLYAKSTPEVEEWLEEYAAS